ncbi:MAG: T9SS type A sorting domain-containing protein [candidate division WOR-3 bacterium]
MGTASRPSLAAELVLGLSLVLSASRSQPVAYFEMQVINRLSFYPYGRVVCGDADRDGMVDVYAKGFTSAGGPDWTVIVALEFAGDSLADSTLIGLLDPMIHAIGDLDGDGLTDLLADDAEDCMVLHVLESADSTSLPLTTVWFDSFPDQGFDLHAICSDFDMDSHVEILAIYTVEDVIRVYENTGDNAYVPRTTLDPGGNGSPRDLAPTSDLDGDGKPELVVGTSSNRVMLYEAVADDSFGLLDTFAFAVGTQFDAVAAAPDMDRDGRSEAIAFGARQGNVGTLVIFESPADDSFEVVWRLTLTAGYYAEKQLAVGDVDGDGVPEFALTTGANVLLFRCTGNDQYEQTWQGYSNRKEVGLYDINRDGKDELICREGNEMVIYEYVSSGLAEQTRRRLEQVIVRPTVAGRGRVVRILGTAEDESSLLPSPCHGEGGRRPGEDDGVRVEVVDAAGRYAEGCDMRIVAGGAVWNTRGVVPGAYFVRVSSGGQSITHKVLILP